MAELKLTFDANALAEAESQLGKSLQEVFASRRFGIREVRALFWAGLKAAEPEITIEEAGARIDAKRIGEVTKAIIGGLSDFFGAPS